MIRDLVRSSKSHIISPDSERRLIIKSLGINPRKGGSPPSESRDMKDSVLGAVSGIDLICLKWKIWLALRRIITEDDTIE